MKKIFWKPEHRLLVAQKSFLLKRDPLFVGSDLGAVRQAQQSLPAELQRDLIHFGVVSGWIIPLWDELAKQGYAESTSWVKPAPEAPTRAVEQQKQQTRSVQIGEVATTDLIGELMKRITEAVDPKRIQQMVREEVHAVLSKSLPGFSLPAEEDVIEPAHLEGPHLNRVLILGLQGGQIEVLRQRYRGKLDMHFMDGSEGTARIKGMVHNMEFSIRSRWCKGNLDTKGWPNFTFINGGLDSIRRILNEKFQIKENA